MAKSTSQKVTFIANKTVKQPTIVRFNTKEGQVAFVVKKNVDKPQIVSFETNPKRK